jgi:O-antigen/teichoic acid export membrane protein
VAEVKSAWTRLLPESVRKKIEGRQYLHNVIHNAGWLLANNILQMGVGLFVGVWVARYLGPEQYGLFNYALAFVALFSSLALLGLDDIVIRNIVRDPDCKDETLGTCFLLKLIGGVITFLLVMAAIFIIRPADGKIHWLVGLIAAGTIFQAFTAIEHWFYSQVQSKYIVWARSAVFIACSLIKILLIVIKAPLIAFAGVGLLEVSAGSAGLVIAYRAKGNLLEKWRGSFGKARELLHDSWPLMFSSVVMMVYMRIDQVMLGEMLGNKEVGIYSAAVRLAEVWFFIPQIIFTSVLPSIVEAKRLSEGLFYERLQKLYNAMALMNYLVAIPVTIMSKTLVVTIFGAEYAGASLMLAVLIWANMFSSLELARSSFLTTMNWTRINFVTIFLGAVINVVLNFFLIPRYGGLGAAVASCISYWFAAHGACFVYRPLFRTGFMLTKAMIFPKFW